MAVTAPEILALATVGRRQKVCTVRRGPREIDGIVVIEETVPVSRLSHSG